MIYNSSQIWRINRRISELEGKLSLLEPYKDVAHDLAVLSELVGDFWLQKFPVVEPSDAGSLSGVN